MYLSSDWCGRMLSNINDILEGINAITESAKPCTKTQRQVQRHAYRMMQSIFHILIYISLAFILLSAMYSYKTGYGYRVERFVLRTEVSIKEIAEYA